MSKNNQTEPLEGNFDDAPRRLFSPGERAAIKRRLVFHAMTPYTAPALFCFGFLGSLSFRIPEFAPMGVLIIGVLIVLLYLMYRRVSSIAEAETEHRLRVLEQITTDHAAKGETDDT